METINQNHEKSLNVGQDEVNNIQIFMNIEQKIDTLRHALQSLLKRDLEQHAFWLSNVKLLDPMQTLLDECATYTGFVQVDIDFLEDPKQIRINDVLQPAEEWIGHVEKAAAQFDGNPTNFVMIINSEPDLHSENLSDESGSDGIELAKEICKTQAGEKPILLWQFLLELLTDREYTNIIQWCGRQGNFKFLDPEGVAKMWGQRKRRLRMNYDKMARSLRYYYGDNRILSKIRSERFMYRFNYVKELVGYTAGQLSDIVNGVPRQLRERRYPQNDL